MIKTELIDIAKKQTPWDKASNVYSNGIDNQYPEKQDRLINNSVTAKTAANTMIQFLLGKGFGEADNIKIGKQKLIYLADDIANELVKQRGLFLHINYNANFKISEIKRIPFSFPRIGKKDDKDYSGKILVSKDWSDKRSKKEVLDVYNPNPKIVEAQVRAASGNKNEPLKPSDFAKYKGQVYYYNCDDEYIYPLSRIDSVQNDCDNEYLASVYKNRILRNGWFGKTMVITRPLVDDNLPSSVYNEMGDLVPNQKLLQQESERDAFKKTIKDFLGAENADGVFHVEMAIDGDETFEKSFLIKNIESNIDDKIFEYTEKSVRRNILIAFNNIPVGLVEASEGVFSNSGEALKEMKRSYWENTTKERNILETIINDLAKNLEDYSGQYLSIQKLIPDDTNQVS